MSQGSNPKKSSSNKKTLEELAEPIQTDSASRQEEDIAKSMEDYTEKRVKAAFNQKRSSAQAVSNYQQNTIISATGGPDQYDEKSGSRIPSNDDRSSHNTHL